MASRRATMNYLRTMLDTMTTVQGVYIAPPESLQFQSGVYFGLDRWLFPDGPMTGHLSDDQDYYGIFVYATDADEEAGEYALADFIDELKGTVLADPTLGGTVADAHVDGAEAGAPQYRFVNAEEVRAFPFRIATTQLVPRP